MRLDFNYIIVDDDWDHHINKRRVEKIQNKINDKIKSKGFIPKANIYKSIGEFEKENPEEKKNRYDLYLSDNNLGNAVGDTDNTHKNDGIELYLDLHSKFLCDFVLYTGSSQEEIINKLKQELDEKKDPNLFTRFTFVTRSSDSNDNWYEPILDLIDHVISKREEMNNLRGLYAQLVSKIDKHLKERFDRPKNEKFSDTIESIDSKYFINSFSKKELHHIRLIRNGLLHNDEEFDTTSNCYVVYYEKRKGSGVIKENDLQKYREWINTAHDTVLGW